MKHSPNAWSLPVVGIRLLGSLRAAISPWRLCAILLISTLDSMRGGTVSWIGASGDWSKPANWSTGSLPGPSDDVVIPAGPSITVTHSTGSDTVNSIVCHEPFTLSGGSLSVANTFQTDNPLNLSGGTLIGATVQANGGSLVVSSGTLDGVTIEGVLDVGNAVNGANLIVTNYMVLIGTALVGNPTNGWHGAITFAGSQLLGGSGTVVFGNGNPNYNALQMANDGTVLVISSGITVRGQNGTVGYSPAYGGPQDVSVINQGTISADVSGGTIYVAAQPLVNQGQLQSPAGTLNLAGTIAPGGLGSVQSSNGVLGLSGFLTNDNQILVLAGTNNALTLQGGTILGGTVVATNGAALIVNGSGTLDGVTVNGTLDVGNSYNGTTLTVLDGLTLNGTAMVGNPAYTAGYGRISFSGSQALGGSGTVVFGGSWSGHNRNALQVLNAGTTLIIGPGITVRGNYGQIGYCDEWGGPQDVSVINQGTISADVSGGTIVVFAQPFNNQQGQLQSPAGTLNLTGRFTTGELGSVQSGNGVLGLSGFLTNDNQVIILAGTSNVLTLLSGGTIHGGTVVATNGCSLTVSSGTLDGVTVNGTLDVGNSYNGASLRVTNGLVLNGTALVGNTNYPYGAINFAGSQTLSGNGTVVFGGYNGWGSGSANALYLAYGGTTLIIGSGITVRGQIGMIGTAAYPWNSPGNMGVVNQGTIQADVSGGTISVNAQPFINLGMVESPAGTVNLAGTLSVLGNFQSGAGPCALSGVLTNTGQTLVMNSATNRLTLQGGTILGGSVTTTGGASLIINGGGTLDGVTVNGTLDVGNTYSGASLTVTGGLVLNGTALVGNTNYPYGAINFAGSQTLNGNGTVVFGGYNGWGNSSANALCLAYGGTTLVIGPGIVVRGQVGMIGAAAYPWNSPANVSVVNQGFISADVGGGTIAIAGGILINAGTLDARNGGVIQPTSSATTNTGTIVIETGKMTFANGFTQTVGTLDFGLNSPTDFGQVTFSGSATLGGTLAAHLGPGYVPNIGQSFDVLNYGTNNLSFANVSLPLSNDWLTNAANGVLNLVVQNVLPYGVTVSPTNSIVAIGSTVTLVASATGPGPLGFQWLHNGTNVIGATNTTLVLTNVSKSATGAYTISVSNSGGSVTSAPVQVQVLAAPAVVVSPSSQTNSVGSLVELSVTVSGDQPLAYQWFFNGANIAGATNSSLSFTDVTRAQAGSYAVVVTNPVGVVTSAPPAVLTVTTGVIGPGAPSGMVAWWRGEGDTSDYASTNDAVFEGTTAYAPGEVGQAFSFDGFSSYLEVPNSPLWDFDTNDFSFELWANFWNTNSSLVDGDGSMVILAHDEEAGTRNKWIFGFGGGEIYFYIYGAGIGPHFLAQAAFNPQTNQWYHLAVTRGGAVFRVYIDGTQVSVETNNVAIPSANAPLAIGEAQGLFMQGLLDEISIYNRALTAGEIASICEAGALGKSQAEQPLTIGPAGFNSSGHFQFQILGGQIGATIQVQASSDLAHWTNVWQTVNTNGVAAFTDSNAALNSRRFYRATSNQ